MARKANEKRLRRVKHVIETQPGQRAGFYARLLGFHRQTINRILVMLNDRDVLLWEDEQGGLYPFDWSEN